MRIKLRIGSLYGELDSAAVENGLLYLESHACPSPDDERFNWLDENPDRLEDVRGRVNNEDESVRAAIDWLRGHP